MRSRGSVLQHFRLGALLRFTKSMTTDSLLARYTVITLKGDSMDGQDG
ncbi:hypothetical protein AWB69_08149 [Caballeronia udeis]|uniref:Uncharacterized protein n=1 Tax=Caballeronia udeis TaxID=1232866 RepID=A0A158JKE5_9BURK|nr:hypothetical protein AWB69_08149 [Caballeronia udeis]